MRSCPLPPYLFFLSEMNDKHHDLFHPLHLHVFQALKCWDLLKILVDFFLGVSEQLCILEDGLKFFLLLQYLDRIRRVYLLFWGAIFLIDCLSSLVIATRFWVSSQSLTDLYSLASLTTDFVASGFIVEMIDMR